MIVSPASIAAAELPASPLAAASSSTVSAAPRRARREELDDEHVAAELRGGGSARRTFTLAGIVVVVLGVAAAFVAGHFNHQRYVLECGTDSVIAKRGRSFPPWGEASLDGPQWKAVSIPPAAECRDREARSEAELGGWYLEILVEQATLRLTARKVVDIDLAAAQLEQALLLARTPERREQRREVERLFGDIEYWHAVEKLRAASDSLAEAAKQFEEAAQKNPKHVTDAPARALQLRRFLEELEGRIAPPIGPNAPILPAPSSSPLSSSSSESAVSPSAPSPSLPTLPAPPEGPASGGDAGPREVAPPASHPTIDPTIDPSLGPAIDPSLGPAPSPGDAGVPPSDAPPPPPAANPSAGGVLL